MHNGCVRGWLRPGLVASGVGCVRGRLRPGSVASPSAGTTQRAVVGVGLTTHFHTCHEVPFRFCEEALTLIGEFYVWSSFNFSRNVSAL